MNSVFDNDKRRFKRFPVDVSIKYRKLDFSNVKKNNNDIKAISAKTTNISEVGVFIATESVLEPDTVMEVTFFFESQERTIKALARCIWVSNEPGNSGMGVEIFKVSQDQYANIIFRAKRSHWVDAGEKPDDEDEDS